MGPVDLRVVRAIVVGDHGTALDCNPGGCVSVATGTIAHLRAVVTEPRAFAVGDAGTVLAFWTAYCNWMRFDPLDPSLRVLALPSPTTRDLLAVAQHCTDKDCLLVVVGKDGAIAELATTALLWTQSRPPVESLDPWIVRPSPTNEDLVEVGFVEGRWRARTRSGTCLLRFGGDWEIASVPCDGDLRVPVRETDAKLWARRDAGSR
jgi:hypothetical protein